MTQVLVVEPQAGVARLIKIELESQAIVPVFQANAEEAIYEAKAGGFDLVIMELLNIDMDGFKLLESFVKLRIPVIVLTTLHDEVAMIRALDLGADGYMTKPFNPAEVTATINSVLRRKQGPPENQKEDQILYCGDIEIDLKRRLARKNGEIVNFSRKSWELLKFLASHPNKVLTSPSILRAIWGPEYVDDSVYLRVWIHRLREIIEADPSRPVFIRTIPRVGYKFVPGRKLTAIEGGQEKNGGISSINKKTS